MSLKSWLADNLRPGSFRGIAFEVDTAEKEFGPRTIVHEFPLRRDAVHEFIGNLPKSFPVEMLLIGDDVIARTAQLEEALDKAESGRLVHPWYGELDVVVVGAVRTRMSTKEGRVARLTATFQLSGAEASPIIAVDTKAAVDQAATRADADLIGDFIDTYVGADVLDFVRDHAGATVQSIAGLTMTALRSAGLSTLMGDTPLAATAARLVGADDALIGDATALGNAVADLFSSSAKNPPAALSGVLLKLAAPAGIPATQVPIHGTTPSWKRAEVNRDALIAHAQIAAAISAVRVGTVTGWDSRDGAMAWRDMAAGNLDLAADLAGARAWDATWKAVTDLRASMVKDVARRAAPLPRLGRMTPPATTPAVMLAYRLNGDDLTGLFDRSADLQRRNAIRHPGFVPGGRALEVLLDA